MKILFVTDAAPPQVNGVVTTLKNTANCLADRGHDVIFLTPYWSGLKTFPFPSYPEVKLVWNVWRIGRIIKKIRPDAIHVATEGTLGIATKIYCWVHKIPHTSSYHTKSPEYAKKQLPWIDVGWIYGILRVFHKGSRALLVTTETVKKELDAYSMHPNMIVWGRGVDLERFTPDFRGKDYYGSEVRGIKYALYAGRISLEKDLHKFLSMSLPDGMKHVIIGDGPYKKNLEERFPDALFLGYKYGEELTWFYANAEVFVFPSSWDAFGIVMLEANACGTPVAAFPVTGAVDVINNGINGYMDTDLRIAVNRALRIPRDKVHAYVNENYSWNRPTDVIENVLVPITHRWKEVE